jgi:hypothetical protein
MVLEVKNGIATVRRLTPHPQVRHLGQHAKDTVLIEGMQAGWRLLNGR